MKLSITDQFLWNLYDELEKLGDIGHFFLRRRRTMYDVFPTSEHRRLMKQLSREQFTKLVYYLKKKNYITVKNLEGKRAVVLTQKGKEKVLWAKFGKEESKKVKRKDGKWIMVMFDVPKQDDRKRNLLRSVLVNLGYKIFQQSVWITPYDVSEKTEEYLQMYQLDKYVKIFIIEEI